MEDQDNRLRRIKEGSKKDREQIFLLHFPIFADFDKEERNFFLQMAAISATIGSFSFFIFDKVNSQIFLICGDLVLGIVITTSVIAYFIRYIGHLRSTADAYHRLFERNTNIIEIIDKYFRKEKTLEEVNLFLQNLVESISPYKRPETPLFSMNKLIIFLFSFAMFLVFLSFFIKV